jgi:hypothetical protein
VKTDALAASTVAAPSTKATVNIYSKGMISGQNFVGRALLPLASLMVKPGGFATINGQLTSEDGSQVVGTVSMNANYDVSGLCDGMFMGDQEVPPNAEVTNKADSAARDAVKDELSAMQKHQAGLKKNVGSMEANLNEQLKKVCSLPVDHTFI